jgi:hypothetical protein
MQEILKGVTTCFKKPFKYRTVDKDRKGQTKYIPERCVWWVAKMEGTGDGQVWNRMLTCWIDDSKEQDIEVLDRELDAATIPPQPEIIRNEVLVCQEIWRSLPDQWVIIPFAKQIKFSSAENRRNPGMLLDIVRSHAILMQFQREHQEYNGTSCIIATLEDFKVACRLFQVLNDEDGGQVSKLTRNESELLMVLRDSFQEEIKISDMQKMTGKSYSAIHKMLHGSISHGNHYSGLLEKCPAISFLDRTDVSDGGGTSKRNRVYVWNAEIYHSWASNGGCWLEGYDPDDHHDDGDDTGGDDGLTVKPFRQNNSCDYGTKSQINENTPEISFTPESPDGTFRRDENEKSPVDSDNSNNNNNNFLDSTLQRKDECSLEAPTETITYIRDFQVSADPIPPAPLARPAPAISQSEADNPSRDVSVNYRHNPSFPPGEYKLKHEKIDPDKFYKLEEVRKGRCDICGKRGVRYVEKGDSGRALCERCMSKAVTREIMSARTLPGTVNIAGMIRVEKSIGKCDICNVGHASWVSDRVKICDTCYNREKRSGEKAEV